MTDDRRKRTSLMVPVMDTEKVKPLLDVVFRALYDEEPPVYTVDEAVITQAMIKEYGVQPVLIGTEGVGHEVNEGNCLDIPCRIPKSMMGGFTIPLHWERIPLRDEPVDLAEFVRRFGDRLESNWRLWNDAITKAQARAEAEAAAKAARVAKKETA